MPARQGESEETRPEHGSRLLRVREVAEEMLGVTPWVVNRLVASGELPFVNLGPRCRRFRREDVEDFIEKARR